MNWFEKEVKNNQKLYDLLACANPVFDDHDIAIRCDITEDDVAHARFVMILGFNFYKEQYGTIAFYKLFNDITFSNINDYLRES